MLEIIFFIFVGAFLAYTYPEPEWFQRIRLKIIEIIRTVIY